MFQQTVQVTANGFSVYSSIFKHFHYRPETWYLQRCWEQLVPKVFYCFFFFFFFFFKIICRCSLPRPQLGCFFVFFVFNYEFNYTLQGEMLDGAQWVEMVCVVRFKWILPAIILYYVLPKLHQQNMYQQAKKSGDTEGCGR